MTNSVDIYEIREEFNPYQGVLRFFFVSKGKRDIIKVVQYEYVKLFDARPIFNFGFGDFDLDAGTVSDEDISNNDDPYKVLNTVLSTVPKLFDIFKNATLFVQGSDSKSEFIDQCRAMCTRKCDDAVCKKAHRRINIYRGFVDKNYDQLNEDYTFFGGEDIENHNLMEPYVKGKKYNGVFVMRKIS